VQIRRKLERTQNQTLRTRSPANAAEGDAGLLLKPPHTGIPHAIARHVIARHVIAAACVALAFTAPGWWQKLAALPFASIAAVASIAAAREADRHRMLLARLESLAPAIADLVPYIDPTRGSNRTGQIVYQFVRPLTSAGASFVTTTLEQLIASFLQVGLAKIDTKLSPATQQQITSAVPTLVSTLASVIVDLAENHKAAKSAVSK
jgi:hypothetical protein